MSEPEANGGQNLEEIIASIRKSLVDEVAEERNVARRPSSVEGEKRDGLTSRLAGALHGAGVSFDGALAAFFAQGLVNGAAGTAPGSSRGTPEAPSQGTSQGPAEGAPRGASQGTSEAAGQPTTQATAQTAARITAQATTRATTRATTEGAAKSLPEETEEKEPLWFLTRGAAADAPQPKSDQAPERAAEPPEIVLSRPETLRPSLPPLFVAGGPAAQSARAPTSASAAAEALPTAAPAKPPQETAPAASHGRAAAEPAAAASRPAPAGTSPAQGQAAAPPKAAGEEASPSPVAPDAAGNAALEEMIAQLLEPVLVRWLDDNLPRMIEKVVRAEVARALSGAV
jgi:cell pole-organizing protein PopZ